jgi:putative ABC transport system permease protein
VHRRHHRHDHRRRRRLPVAAFTPIPASVPFSAVVAALLMAATAGVLFGMWPAWKAARMDPVEALRYE